MMRVSTDSEGVIRVNNLTFLEFMDFFRGKIILNKRGNPIPKYLLFWSGGSPEKIKENFTLINRK